MMEQEQRWLVPTELCPNCRSMSQIHECCYFTTLSYEVVCYTNNRQPKEPPDDKQQSQGPNQSYFVELSTTSKSDKDDHPLSSFKCCLSCHVWHHCTVVSCTSPVIPFNLLCWLCHLQYSDIQVFLVLLRCLSLPSLRNLNHFYDFNNIYDKLPSLQGSTRYPVSHR